MVSTVGLANTPRLGRDNQASSTKKLFDALHAIGIDVKIYNVPQEISQPIPFEEDVKNSAYNAELANAWWRILLSSQLVMQRYHARFRGITPPIGLMWGTFDLRDARYLGKSVPTTGINATYIRRNAMDDAQVEVGFWSGNENYQRPAYFSFTYPQPEGIERARILPKSAKWMDTISLFVLDYDDVRKSSNPAETLLSFFESTYHAGTQLAGWDPKLISAGIPV